MNRLRLWRALLISLALAFSAAFAGAIFTAPATMAGGWYGTLATPPWTPPSWLFGPVWTVLYATMAIAAWLVWRARGSFTAARGPLAIYLLQLLLNAGWSVVFFGLRLPGVAVVVIILLWLGILATLLVFRRVHPSPAGCFCPICSG